MTLPRPAGGATTTQVGYFDVEASSLADWIIKGLDNEWVTKAAEITSLQDAIDLLSPSAELTRYVCLPIGDWSALLSNGPLGTDVGLLPSYAARELNRRAIRVVNIEDYAPYPARMLEVFGPEGAAPLAMERSIVAANDGRRWVFETTGSPYPFEEQQAYSNHRKSKRFTSEMLFDYLRSLGAPTHKEPDWSRAVLIERTPSGDPFPPKVKRIA